MKKFKYSARTRDGKLETGEIEAETRTDVVKELQGRGLIVVSINDAGILDFSRLAEINVGGIPLSEKVVFMRQFAVMLSAGLPITQTLEILYKQAQNPSFKKSIDRILTEVQSGHSLGDSMEKETDTFDKITINLIKAGEESGALDRIFLRLADEWEKKREFSSKVQNAMIYPIVIMVTMIGVVALLMVFMIPTVSSIYKDFGGELPFLTQLLVNISNFTVSWWPLLIFVGVLIVFGYRAYYSSDEGKKKIDEFLLKMPIFSNLITKIQLQRFTRTLYLLIKSGVPILDSLNLTADSLDNYWFKQGVLDASTEVKKGVSLAIPLSRNRYFPLIVSQMIAVGEETGKLDKVLLKMSEYFENEVKNLTDNLSTLIEPIMLVLMGGVVALLALAVYMPMFNLSQLIQ